MALIEQDSRKTEAYVLDQNIFRPFLNGPFSGEDAREVYDMAIKWWEAQLDTIDADSTVNSSR